MGRGGESFEHRQRERAKKAKAAAKREQRQQGSAGVEGEATEPVAAGEAVEQSTVLDELSSLHQAFEDGTITFDDFEEQRGKLLAMLQVE